MSRNPREYLRPAWRDDPDFVPWTPTTVAWEDATASRRASLTAAWTRGVLRYKLNPDQRVVYDAFRAWQADKKRGKYFGLDISRRWGKSYLMLIILLEEVIRGDKSKRWAYFTDTERMAGEITHPLLDQILADCPPELRPTWVSSKKRYIFPSNSKLEVFGLDDPNKGRGRHLDGAVLDEFAFMDQAEYIITSVIHPQMQGRRDAFVIAGTTPPVSPQHYWSAIMIHTLRAEGACENRTIFDNPGLTDAEIEKEIAVLGGDQSTACRRELFAEHVIEKTMAIIPEYVEVSDEIFGALPARPDWFGGYVSLDPGWKDASGVLFAIIDFAEQKLHIEDEICATQLTSAELAAHIAQKERDLWPAPTRWSRGREEAEPNPHRRWTDVDNRLIADLAQDHGISFSPTAKDNKDQQVVRVRNWIAEGRVLISERCEHLDRQLRTGVYKNQLRRDFARSDGEGHFDLIDALIYLCRNVEPYFRSNPKPPFLHGVNHGNTFVSLKERHGSQKETHRPRLSHRPGRFRSR